MEIGLIRATVLTPYLEHVGGPSAPIERMLERHRLPPSIESRSSEFVPTMRFWQFVNALSHYQGDPDLGLKVGAAYGRHMLGPFLGPKLVRSRTLFEAIQEFTKYTLCDNNQFTSSMYIDHDNVLWACDRPCRDPHVTGFGQTEWMVLVTLVGVVRLYAGPTWAPPTIRLQQWGLLSEVNRACFPTSRILFGDKYCGIAFPRPLLALPPLKNEQESWQALIQSRFGNQAASPANHDFVGGVGQTLRAFLPDGYPKIDLVAEVLDMSMRTLQRRLQEAGASYSQLVTRARVDLAREFLTNPDYRIADVAYSLGYTDSSNFARAFRAATGVAPQEYRRNVLYSTSKPGA